MAEYSRREKKTERVEFSVPAEYRYGACWVEVMKAIRAAHQELWDLGLYPEGKDVPDDAIRIYPSDEEIVVSFTIERNGDTIQIA